MRELPEIEKESVSTRDALRDSVARESLVRRQAQLSKVKTYRLQLLNQTDILSHCQSLVSLPESDLSRTEVDVPRFYFDIRDADGFHPDEAGDEFADFEEARQQCQGLVADIVREELPGEDQHTIICDVRDQSGRVIYRGEIIYRGTRDPM